MPTGPDPRELLGARATDVAPWLLGAVISSIRADGTVAVRITEVEAYEGVDDPASHAFRGSTARNAVMFGPPGFLYVYFVYGMHWCANVVCGPIGRSSALLIRAGAVVEGIPLARSRRAPARRETELARGPARLADCLALTGTDGGVDLFDPSSAVRLTLPREPPVGYIRGPRVGIAVATDAALRFSVAGDPTVSVFRTGGRSRPPANRQTGRS